MKKVAFFTLGCKVNQYETNAMEKLFINSGYSVVPFDEIADIYIVNTCTVTSVADKKSRNMLRRAKTYNKNAIIAAVGCLAQTAPEKIKKIDCIDVIIGTNQKSHIVFACEKAMQEKEKVTLISDVSKTNLFEDMSIESFEGRQRACVKIQEGCDSFCSYCIIPYARGAVRSRAVESILKEAERLGGNGFSEIVLTGIHIASYGRNTEINLGKLIQMISNIDSIKRIRLSSIDPMAFSEDFINILSNTKKVCHHFHISLQSGSSQVLKKMNRRYTPSFYMDVLKKLRKAMPDVAITTDIITGFPYETDEEFEKSLDFVKKATFAGVHVFPYSERQGTPAAKFGGNVEKAIRSERAHKMTEIAFESKQTFMKKFIGTTADVLFEKRNKENYIEGFTPNYIRVLVKTEKNLEGKIIPVKLTDAKKDFMVAEII